MQKDGRTVKTAAHGRFGVAGVMGYGTPLRKTKPATVAQKAQAAIDIERALATGLHGPLKPGYDRWARLLAEEMEEVADELILLPNVDGHTETVERAIVELAQLAQLCHGCIEHLIMELEGANHGG